MKNVITLFAVLVSFAAAVFAADGDGVRGELKAGLSRVDITPPVGLISTGMRRIHIFIVALAFAFLLPRSASASELILAGGSEVFIVDATAAQAGTFTKLWRWSGADAPDLPESARREFDHLDECKPVEDGTKLLLCASNGGCALIDRATHRIVWRVHVRNAHSLTLLPRGRIVVASSLSGDHLEVFDLAGGATPVFKTRLHSAHGVVWDDRRRCLWALGFDELRAYTLDQWETDKPALKLKSTHPLPDNDGHDLLAVPKSDELTISTEHSVHSFDRNTNAFKPHPELAAEKNIKSVDVHPLTGQIVLSDWSPSIRLANPAGTIRFKDARPYKARWLH